MTQRPGKNKRTAVSSRTVSFVQGFCFLVSDIARMIGSYHANRSSKDHDFAAVTGRVVEQAIGGHLELIKLKRPDLVSPDRAPTITTAHLTGYATCRARERLTIASI